MYVSAKYCKELKVEGREWRRAKAITLDKVVKEGIRADTLNRWVPTWQDSKVSEDWADRLILASTKARFWPKKSNIKKYYLKEYIANY